MPGPVVEDIQFDIKIEEEIPVADVDVDEYVEEDDVVDADSDDDDEDDKEDGVLGGSESSNKSRIVKKIREAMLKLGLKPVHDVSRVSIKRTKNVKFFISKPDVFKTPYSETYVIFGEAKSEDSSSQLQTQAAQQFRIPNMGKSDISTAEEVDESCVDPLDVDLVLSQARVTRAMAVKALKTHNGDIVSAIMELIP